MGQCAIAFELRNAQALQLLPPVAAQKQLPTISLGMTITNKTRQQSNPTHGTQPLVVSFLRIPLKIEVRRFWSSNRVRKELETAKWPVTAAAGPKSRGLLWQGQDYSCIRTAISGGAFAYDRPSWPAKLLICLLIVILPNNPIWLTDSALSQDKAQAGRSSIDNMSRTL